jgi:hypothetical protein
VTSHYWGAFGLSDPKDREALFDTIPGDSDVVVTHGPPFGIMDGPPCASEHAGDEELLERVMELRPIFRRTRLSAGSRIFQGLGLADATSHAARAVIVEATTNYYLITDE